MATSLGDGKFHIQISYRCEENGLSCTPNDQTKLRNQWENLYKLEKKKFYAKSISSSMKNKIIGIVGRVFDNGPGDRGSVPDRVIPRTEKMVLDSSNASEANSGKEERLPLHLGVVAVKKRAFMSPSIEFGQLIYD